LLIKELKNEEMGRNFSLPNIGIYSRARPECHPEIAEEALKMPMMPKAISFHRFFQPSPGTERHPSARITLTANRGKRFSSMFFLEHQTDSIPKIAHILF
jgi:hypothetical protein